MNRQPGALSVTGVVALIALCLLFSAQTVCAQGDSRRASPPAGKALVFVFRSDRQPVAGQLPVTVSGNKLGELANGTYVTATVNPGRAFLRIGDRVVNTLSFAVAANQSYFVMVEAVPGVRPLRAVLNPVSEATGRRALAQSRFVGAGAAPILAAPRAAQAAEVPKRVPPAPAATARPQPPSRAAQPAPRPAPAARAYTPSVQEQGWDLAFIAKAGAFKMANDSQVVGGRPSTYDVNSAWVGGFEFEWRSRKGPAAGVELFYYKNDLTANGTGLGGRQTVGAYMLNGKYYFRAADRWYPFVGVGVGATNASYNGNLTGKASGFAYQGLAGIEFRYENLGVLLQYKYLASTTDDGAGEKVKVGGNGILAGVSLSF